VITTVLAGSAAGLLGGRSFWPLAGSGACRRRGRRRCGTDRADAVNQNSAWIRGSTAALFPRRSRARLNPPGQRAMCRFRRQLGGPSETAPAPNDRRGSGGDASSSAPQATHFRDHAHRFRAFLMADGEQPDELQTQPGQESLQESRTRLAEPRPKGHYAVASEIPRHQIAPPLTPGPPHCPGRILFVE